MGLRFTVLASGSAGNATLLETDGHALMIDAGMTVRELSSRLEKTSVTWEQIRALILTHTHSDHWNDSVFALLYKYKVPLYCHAGHADILGNYSRLFSLLRMGGLIHEYQNDVEVRLPLGISCKPIAVRHDSGPTFGFRLEAAPDLFGDTYAVGYASDLGCWDNVIASAFANVDLLAIEYNHDVILQRQSRRPQRLVARVLGNEGHLSNRQASDLLKAVLQRSEPGRLQHVVQLHLSRDCNRPTLAVGEARRALEEMQSSAKIHTACQHRVTPSLRLDTTPRRSRKRLSQSDSDERRIPAARQLTLPGFEED